MDRLRAAILLPMETSVDQWVRAELHLHTYASMDSLVQPQKLLEHCARIGINRVAITDHNSIDGALAAKALAPERVIVGEEIETTQGELLGYFLREWIPGGLEPMEAIERLRGQGAAISVSHPFEQTRGPKWTYEQLLAIAPHVDAIETYNARCFTNQPNEEAAAFAQEHGLQGTVGSDAHSLFEVGRAVLYLPPFEDAAGFLAALPLARPHTRLSPPYVHLFSRYAHIHKKMLQVLRIAEMP
ncbi:MAG: PHP domain-containing protein [Brevefilum sp.]|nr:PHP domain-containing protein [Brevefilum sp.]